MALIKKYLSLIKFSHTVFALPFALVGFFLGVRSLLSEAEEVVIDFGFYAFSLLLVILCMVFARSAAMAFNRYLDRHFDAKNPRTVIREIPAGLLSANQVLWFTIVMSGLFMLTAWMINTLCFTLSPIALLVILGYSYTKRFTPLCHLVLGLGLSLAPTGAFLSMTGYFSWEPVVLSFAVLFWVAGFDIIYALQDEGFDKEQGLKSIPVSLGGEKALRLSRVFHLITAVLLFILGRMIEGGLFYYTGAAIFTALLIYQHTLVKPTDLRKVNQAFFTTNGLASIIFGVFAMVELLS
ncbi:MAG: putative 4-hydroxybenzoate polyprenyltransferase [Bacteroidetes bacterium]|nr:putative 4-hydroxybenzoate polyprenyltransferase [Bacteroidota bacterium]